MCVSVVYVVRHCVHVCIPIQLRDDSAHNFAHFLGGTGGWDDVLPSAATIAPFLQNTSEIIPPSHRTRPATPPVIGPSRPHPQP